MTEFKPFYLGRYKILNELGRGAMGVVYKGLDSVLVRVVAVKTINILDPNIPMSEEDILEIFLREAKIAGNLTHPNITSIYDIGSDRGIHFFVMEFVEGSTMESVIERREKMSLIGKLKIIAATARTLSYAHMRNVVHRDIKPANIMILKNNEPKIMDFGVAKLQGGALIDKTEAGKIFGTPNYMSPEQIKGEDVDHQTDIFSLGVSAYEFLTYEKPFPATTFKDLLRAIINNEPVPLSHFDPSIPEELGKIISKALNKDKSGRYNHASQFADALELLIDKMESASSTPQEEITQEKQKIIKAIKRNYVFFSDFDDEEIMEIFKLSSRESFDKGMIIFEEGATGNKMFIIIEGKVKIFQRDSRGSEVEIAVLEDGDCFGEMAIIDNSPRSASAMAMEETVVVAINEIVLRVTRPELCVKLYKILASIISEKLRHSDRRLREILADHKRWPSV